MVLMALQKCFWLWWDPWLTKQLQHKMFLARHFAGRALCVLNGTQTVLSNQVQTIQNLSNRTLSSVLVEGCL